MTENWHRWTTRPGFGLLLGLAGALVITPDTLFMRLSGMEGWAMLAWRGILCGLVLGSLWLIFAKNRRQDCRILLSRYGIGACLAGGMGGLFFTLAVAETSVVLVLVCLAVSPVFAALISRLLLGEQTYMATWLVILVAFGGVALAVLDADSVQMVTRQGGGSVLLGAGFSLLAAILIGVNFVCLRANPRLNVVLVTGTGTMLSGVIGLLLVAPQSLWDGDPLMISVSGALILPLSFFCLTSATRYTQAANISLLMILETVLGPVWVWLFVGEQPGNRAMIGGAIVVSALIFYIRYMMRKKRSEPAP
ncbi:MAG: DMT family transporter [Alphaproteobacteria bacterium]|jgi:drug/metabolite transporter (DMT)-like permease|nr:DMT family transporter [Alphaproteobacteria bacterium]